MTSRTDREREKWGERETEMRDSKIESERERDRDRETEVESGRKLKKRQRVQERFMECSLKCTAVVKTNTKIQYNFPIHSFKWLSS